MTMNETNPKNLGKIGYGRGGQSKCFQRRELVTIAFKVGVPLPLSANEGKHGLLKEIFVVEAAFKNGTLAGNVITSDPRCISLSVLYRNCSDVKRAFDLLYGVLLAGGAVGFCCSVCCGNHAVTPVASGFFCEYHYVYPS